MERTHRERVACPRSTLVALDCAAQGKRLGKCDRSIVAGSNLSLGCSFLKSVPWRLQPSQRLPVPFRQLCPNTWVSWQQTTGFCNSLDVCESNPLVTSSKTREALSPRGGLLQNGDGALARWAMQDVRRISQRLHPHGWRRVSDLGAGIICQQGSKLTVADPMKS